MKVPVETKDEIGKLASAINKMSAALNERENELKASEVRLRIFSSQLLNAQEKERERVSKELHDELGQALALLKHRIRSVQRKLSDDQSSLKEDCDDTSRYIDQIIENVRRLSRDLHPFILESLGLSAALAWLFDNLGKQYSILTSVRMENIDQFFSPEAQTKIYRIFQEALTNIGKHAKAENVSFEIKEEDDHISLSVADDGIGFDVSQTMSENSADKGMGLATMHERAHMLGAELGLVSQINRGTKITLTVPSP